MPTQMGRTASDPGSLRMTMGMLVTGSIIRPRIFISTSIFLQGRRNAVASRFPLRSAASPPPRPPACPPRPPPRAPTPARPRPPLARRSRDPALAPRSPALTKPGSLGPSYRESKRATSLRHHADEAVGEALGDVHLHVAADGGRDGLRVGEI